MASCEARPEAPTTPDRLRCHPTHAEQAERRITPASAIGLPRTRGDTEVQVMTQVEPLELTPEVQTVIDACREFITGGGGSSIEALYGGNDLPELQSAVREQVDLLVRLARAGQLVGVELEPPMGGEDSDDDVVARCSRAVARWRVSRDLHKNLRARTTQAKNDEREKQQARDKAVLDLAAARPDWGTQRMGKAVGLPEKTLRDILTKAANPR